MSEAELHILKARMRGGVLNKARRGELEMMPPGNLAYQDIGVLGLGPDASVPAALRLVFDTLERTGSTFQSRCKMVETASAFRAVNAWARRKGDLTWAVPSHSRAR